MTGSEGFGMCGSEEETAFPRVNSPAAKGAEGQVCRYLSGALQSHPLCPHSHSRSCGLSLPSQALQLPLARGGEGHEVLGWGARRGLRVLPLPLQLCSPLDLGCYDSRPKTASPLPPAQQRSSLGIMHLSGPHSPPSSRHAGDPHPSLPPAPSLKPLAAQKVRGKVLQVPSAQVASSGPRTGPHISPGFCTQSQTPRTHLSETLRCFHVL